MNGMKKRRWATLAVAAILAVPAIVVHADVKTTEKTHFQFGGALGRVVNMFGGKATREGVETTVALKGDVKMSRTGNTGQIIDLGQEKIYDIDYRHKTYKVTTFAELRQQMEEARKRAEQDAAKGKKEEPAEQQKPEKEYQADFDAKETGQRKTINGFACREVIATVTVHEKGKTLEEGGGLVLTDDMWLTPTVPAMKEIAAFNVRYYKQLAGPYAAGVPEGQMAMAAGMFPGLSEAFGKLNTEHVNFDGTPIVSDIKVESVKSPEQMAEEQKSQEDDSGSSHHGFGGLFGGIAKKIEKKAEGGDKNGGSARTTAMTTHHEVLSVSTDVGADDVAIPAGFKQKN